MNDAHYAVVVGINRYPGIRDLRHARGDAEAFRDWLIDPEGGDVPAGNVHLITATDQEAEAFGGFVDARPTKPEIDKALWKINEQLRPRVDDDPNVWDRSRLYFYVSGHGMVPRGGRAALLMANAGSGWFGESIELTNYAEHYVRCGSIRELVFFADCCRDPSRVAQLTGPPFDACDAPLGTAVKVLGFAAPYGLKAQEPPDDADSARGYFTQALLSGLRGGVRSETGVVDSNNLGGYVRVAVQQLAAAAGYEQDAVVEADIGHPIVFRAGASAAPKRAVSITLPQGFSGAVRLVGGSLEEVAVWDAADGTWKGELAEGFYRVVPAAAAAAPFASGGFFQVAAGDLDVAL